MDGLEISDMLRECIFMEESENYTLFTEEERNEFLFKIFNTLIFGG